MSRKEGNYEREIVFTTVIMGPQPSSMTPYRAVVDVIGILL